MRPTMVSPAISTLNVAQSRDFYQKYFAATLVFDCGWFISLEFGQGLSVQFMEPQGGQPACNTNGLIYNFRVANVDDDYQKLIGLGLSIDGAPEDHPWGDRGFSVKDPNGIMLYIYSDREPSPEFASAFLNRGAA